MAITWNPSDKHADITLSNGNLTAAHTGSSNGQAGVRASESKSSGKWYFEIYLNKQTANAHTIGIIDAAHSLSKRAGEDGGAVGVGWHTGTGRIYRDGGYVSFGGSAAEGDYVQIAVDFSNGNIWLGVNNSWLSDGDPANGTNPAYTEDELTSGNFFATATLYDTGDHICTLRAAAADMAGTIPSGFSAYDAAAAGADLLVSFFKPAIKQSFNPFPLLGGV